MRSKSGESSVIPLVLKFGGELLEDATRLGAVVSTIARVLASRPANAPGLVIVHGGGHEIDAALKVAGIDNLFETLEMVRDSIARDEHPRQLTGQRVLYRKHFHSPTRFQ